MNKGLQRINFSLIASVALHGSMLLLAIYTFKDINRRGNVDVSVISSQEFSEICHKQDRKLSSKPKIKKVIKTKSEKVINEVLQKKQPQSPRKKQIQDLSYTKSVYKIGSKHNPPPPYPRIAKLRNIQGKVEICIISDNKGNVVNAEIHKSSGYSILDKSALKTIKGWQFNIDAVSANNSQDNLYRVIIPINFVMNN